MGNRFILIGASRNACRLFGLTGTQFLLDEQDAASLLDRFVGTDSNLVVEVAAPDRGVRV
jgi:hypothetical protein